MLTRRFLRIKVLHALYKKAGLQTPGQGIAFAMPVDGLAGLSLKDHSKTELPETAEA